jgi:hypothetical protein
MPTPTEVTMETYDSELELSEGVRGKIARARTSASDAIGHLPEIAGKTRDGAGQVAERLPDAYAHAKSGAQGAVTRLQKVPDSGLRLLTAASIGLGTGLRLAGAPRLVTLAGFAPASVFGFAILSRPHPAPSKT